MRRVHFQVRVGVFNCQQILAKISFVIFDIVIKNKSNVACILSFRKSRNKPNLENTSKYGFSPDLRGKNGGVLSMRMQVILDSSFARPGSYMGRKKGEFRDWTRSNRASNLKIESNER